MIILKLMKTKSFGLFCIYLILSSTIYCQEALSVLRHNAVLVQHNNVASQEIIRYSTSDTLGLPFLDDFTYFSNFPDQSLWIDSHVFINRTLTESAPTIGIASFDGLNKKGLPYNDISYAYGPADTLTSKCIDLSNYDSLDDLFLSFHYGSEGYGDTPENSDSILLEFKDSLNVWSQIWDTFGIVQNFEQAILPILDSTFFHNCFQFRFRNYATISGNNDHWHLDYIKLDANRDSNDLVYSDVAIKSIPKTILQPYTSMPWSHYEQGLDLLKPNHSFTVTSFKYDPNGTGGVSYNFKLSQPGFSWADSLLSSPPTFMGWNGDTTRLFNQPHDLSSLNHQNDSISLRVEYRINKTGGNNNLENDTVFYMQHFHNYFAYDDGSAEKAYGLISPGSKLAMEFNLSHEDTIHGVLIHWASIDINKSNEFFSLTIWDSLNLSNDPNKEDSIAYKKDFLTPAYVDSLNGWTYYPITDTMLKRKAGKFYLGWIQTTSELLNIGFDRNQDNSDRIFYNVGGPWGNTQYAGTIMIRPVMDNGLDYLVPQDTTNITEINKGKSIKTFPNPFKDQINIINPKREPFNIYNSIGTLVFQSLQPEYSDKILLSDYPPGLFILKTLSGSEQIKILKL